MMDLLVYWDYCARYDCGYWPLAVAAVLIILVLAVYRRK